MIKFLLALSVLVIPQLAIADENDAVCRVLKKQAQSSVDYVPGVDAYGRPVIAPDGLLPALISDLPTRIKVPLSIDLAQQIPSLQAQGIEMDADLGIIEVDGQGRVFRGDEDITDYAVEECNLPNPEELDIRQGDLELPQNLFGAEPVEVAPMAGSETDVIIEVENLNQPVINQMEITQPTITPSFDDEISNDVDEIDDQLFGQ